MSSFKDLLSRVYVLEEAKGRQNTWRPFHPAFGDIQPRMSERGMSSPPYDAIKFLSDFLYKLNIFTHDEMQGVMSSGDFSGKKNALIQLISQKSKDIIKNNDEIIEKMPEALEYYINDKTINRGASKAHDEENLGRTEKYAQQAAERKAKKEAAATLRQQRQALKQAGQGADGATNAALKVIDTGLDQAEKSIVALGAGMKAAEDVVLDFDDIDINIGALRERDIIIQKLIQFFNRQSGSKYKAESMPKGLNVEGPKGAFGTNPNKINDIIVGLIKKSFPNIDERQVVVDLHADSVESEDAEDMEVYYDDPYNKGVNPDEAKEIMSSNEEIVNVVGYPHIVKYGDSGEVVSVETKEPGANIDVSLVNKYLKTGFPLERAIAAATSHPNDTNTGNEDAMMMGEGVKTLRSGDLINQLQDVINTPDEKLTDVTNISIRLSDQREIFDRFPKIYPYIKQMFTAVMSEGGAVKTKEIAKQAIEEIQKNYPSADKYQRANPTFTESYTSAYLTEQTRKDSLTRVSENTNQSFKERYKPKTSYQLEELRRYGL